MSTPLTAQTDPWSSLSDFPTPFVGKMPKNGQKREESYEGHLGFKSEVSPLIFPLGEEEEKRKRRLSYVEPNLIARQKDGENQRKKSFC